MDTLIHPIVLSEADKALMLSPEAALLAQSAYAENTKRAYQHGLQDFQRAGGKIPASPEAIAHFISTARRADGGEYSAATMALILAAVGKAHTLAGYPSPLESEIVKTTIKGYRRQYGTMQRRAKPVLLTDLHKLVAEIDRGGNKAKRIRDKALALVWWAGLFRRSEVVALRIEHIEFTEDGAVILLPKSKTDQEGKGQRIGIPRGRDKATCPVAALGALINLLKADSGAVFRNLDHAGKAAGGLTPASAARILKGYAEKAGLEWGSISGHSMRAGGATEAAQRGVDLWKLSQHGRWKDTRMLTERYIREARLFVDNPMIDII